jgi:hypothetical protein
MIESKWSANRELAPKERAMPLPASLVQSVEQHPCFPGVFSADANVQVCLQASGTPQVCRVVSCSECYQKFGVLETLLPSGTDAYLLARQLTQHVRQLRGYTLAIGGYHAKGPGFWVSTVYFASCGVFLIDGARSRALGPDLDLLLLAFRHGVLTPFDPRLLDPKQFRTRQVHVRCATPPGAVQNLQALLAWSGCQTQAAAGFQPVTLAEFLPVATAVAPAPASAPAGKANAARLKPGDVCPVCKAVICARPLLNGTYVGCLC